jgi:hypothetical protein
MFSRSDGPTALRADLVRALSFSSQQCELPAQEGTSEPAVAALAGVWNGHKGFVALVVYRIPSQNVERYVFADPIDSERGVDQAVDEGLAFAESFGFGMDAPDFLSLPVEQQEQRLRVWNKLRKPRPGIAAPVPLSAPRLVLEHTGDIDPTATPTPVPAAELPAAAAAPTAEPPAASTAPAAAAETSGGRAVLGRIELVRRGVEAPRPDPLIRLLSYL